MSVVKKVADYVSKIAGIQLTESQYPMIEARLKSRINKLKLSTLESYMNYLETNELVESQHLLSLITTHYTYFFREFDHFEYIINKALPAVLDDLRHKGIKKINILSAGCSHGEEAYSLAMFFSYHLRYSAPDFEFHVDAGDVDSESVKKAANGVYKVEGMKQIPAMYVGDHWIKGTGSAFGFAKIKDSLKQKITFNTLNVLAPATTYKNKKYDFIFCRNVYIYFHENQIRESATRLIEMLNPSGYFFTGVSESLTSLNLPIQSVGASIYRHKVIPALSLEAQKSTKSVPVGPIRVLSVDDSPTILNLLKTILTPANGFELVHTCSNGEEALKFLESGKKIDAITLDIHMPIMDGITFLEKTKNITKPPVLMLSSVDRDDPGLGQKVIGLGAFDYVEKPSLQNLSQASEEIRAKLKLMHRQSPELKATKSLEPNVKVVSQNAKKNKVLIIDDSQTVRKLLRNIIQADPAFEVVGEVENPLLASKAIAELRPDLITLDVHMPEMNGVELLKKLKGITDAPVIMVSSISKEEGPFIVEALSLGAIDYIQKPQFDNLDNFGLEIRKKLKLICESRNKSKKFNLAQPMTRLSGNNIDPNSLILIGASTGGVEAIPYVLKSLPSHMPPIFVVQHIPAGFSQAFAKRLQEYSGGQVKQAEHGEKVLPNHVYLAPGGMQMSLKLVNDSLTIRIDPGSEKYFNNPSVDFLFSSVAQIKNKNVVAALLTGMGDDGAKGMLQLKKNGARTIAQDESTSVVYGMPREAILCGSVEASKALPDIAATIVQFSKLSNSKKIA